MNIGVKKLFHINVSASPKIHAGRLQIEDNIGEAIHIHWRNHRLDFSIRDFFEFEKGCHDAVLKILEHFGLDPHKLNKNFLISILKYADDIVGVNEKYVRLSDLYIIELKDNGWRAVPIDKSLPYGYLTGNKTPYSDYINRFGSPHHRPENLDHLWNRIMAEGYDERLEPIVTFGDEPYIRDGQHRAAIIYHLKGDIEIPVLNIQFKKESSTWRMKKSTRGFVQLFLLLFKKTVEFMIKLFRFIFRQLRTAKSIF